MAMRSPGPSVTKSHVSLEQREPEHSLGWGFSRNVDWQQQTFRVRREGRPEG
jgi:hypothetical protein